MKRIYFTILASIVAFTMSAQESFMFHYLQKASNVKTTKSIKSIESADYSEDFQGGAPGMTTENLDGNSDAAAITNMGIDFSSGWLFNLTFDQTNLFAASNSIFEPVGQADRWMYTPAITLSSDNAILSFSGMSANLTAGGAETYEVYVTTTIAGSAPASTDFGTPVLTVDGEATSWTDHTVDLAGEGYATDDVIYIAWRHTSNNQQALAIDDIYVGSSITNNMEILTSYVSNSVAGYMGMVPRSQLLPVEFTQTVLNSGADTQTGVNFEVTLSNMTSTVFTNNSNSVSIDAGNTDSLVCATTYTIPTGSGVDQFEAAFDLTQNEADEIAEDSKDTVTFMISDSEYGYVAEVSTFFSMSTLATYGAGDGFVCGHQYGFAADADINAISVMIYTGTSATGVTFTGKLYNVTDMSVVAETAPYTVTQSDIDNMLVTIPFTSAYAASAGTSVFAGIEMTYGSNEVVILGDASPLMPSVSTLYLPNGSQGANWYSFTGLPANSVSISISEPTKTEVVSNVEVNVYPNPAKESINIENANNSTVSVYNLIGELVLQENVNNTVYSLDISNLTEGTYIVKIDGKEGVTTKKISVL